MNPANAREFYKYRTKMYNAKFNYKSNERHANDLWQCSSCQSAIETQEHVLFCGAYATLREQKDLNSDKDLAEYLRKVLIIREKLNLIK